MPRRELGQVHGSSIRTHSAPRQHPGQPSPSTPWPRPAHSSFWGRFRRALMTSPQAPLPRSLLRLLQPPSATAAPVVRAGGGEVPAAELARLARGVSRQTGCGPGHGCPQLAVAPPVTSPSAPTEGGACAWRGGRRRRRRAAGPRGPFLPGLRGRARARRRRAGLVFRFFHQLRRETFRPAQAPPRRDPLGSGGRAVPRGRPGLCGRRRPAGRGPPGRARAPGPAPLRGAGLRRRPETAGASPRPCALPSLQAEEAPASP